jgi:hypothetical protein
MSSISRLQPSSHRFFYGQTPGGPNTPPTGGEGQPEEKNQEPASPQSGDALAIQRFLDKRAAQGQGTPEEQKNTQPASLQSRAAQDIQRIVDKRAAQGQGAAGSQSALVSYSDQIASQRAAQGQGGGPEPSREILRTARQDVADAVAASLEKNPTILETLKNDPSTALGILGDVLRDVLLTLPSTESEQSLFQSETPDLESIAAAAYNQGSVLAACDELANRGHLLDPWQIQEMQVTLANTAAAKKYASTEKARIEKDLEQLLILKDQLTIRLDNSDPTTKESRLEAWRNEKRSLAEQINSLEQQKVELFRQSNRANHELSGVIRRYLIDPPPQRGPMSSQTSLNQLPVGHDPQPQSVNPGGIERLIVPATAFAGISTLLYALGVQIGVVPKPPFLKPPALERPVPPTTPTQKLKPKAAVSDNLTTALTGLPQEKDAAKFATRLPNSTTLNSLNGQSSGKTLNQLLQPLEKNGGSQAGNFFKNSSAAAVGVADNAAGKAVWSQGSGRILAEVTEATPKGLFGGFFEKAEGKVAAAAGIAGIAGGLTRRRNRN